MKNKKIFGILLITIIMAIVLTMTNVVFAADEPVLDLDDIGNEETENKDDTEDEEPDDLSGQIQKPETPADPADPADPENDDSNNPPAEQENEESKDDIPYTGPETSIAIIVAFVACAMIGVYTFVKLSDYNNI